MKSNTIAAIGLVLAALHASPPALAAPAPARTVVTPTSDGWINLCDGCTGAVSGDNYVVVGGTQRGDVKFSMASLRAPQAQVLLALEPYARPLWGRQMDVYGFGSTLAALDPSDAGAGAYLGTLVLDDDVGYGKDAIFDVTAFVNGVRAPYVGFELRSDDADVFSSLEYHLAHPSELIATAAPVPEPAGASLMLAGAFATAGLAWRRRRAP